MNFWQLLSAARHALADTHGQQDSHHLLTEEAGLRYFNEAISEACRRAHLIIDRSTTTVCSYAITPGQAVITLHPSIVKIRRASLAGSGLLLRRAYAADLDDRLPGWESRTGPVDTYVNDYEAGASKKIRLYRIPTAADTLQLVVSRTPVEELQQATSIPEIAPAYHYALVGYVVAKMRRIEDTELYDPRKALAAEAEFEREFGPKRSARDETWEDSQPFAEYE